MNYSMDPLSDAFCATCSSMGNRGCIEAIQLIVQLFGIG